MIYCSQSSWGDETNPFASQAHYVVLNGEPANPGDPRAQYDWRRDGKIIQVRPESEKGTRVPENGMNDIAIQVCLIGTPCLKTTGLECNFAYISRAESHSMIIPYTERQIQALLHLLVDICNRYDIWPSTRVIIPAMMHARRRTVFGVTQRSYHHEYQAHDPQLNIMRIQEAVTGYRIDNQIPPLPGKPSKS